MSSNSHMILLVDDNDDLREVTTELLEAMGHRVLEAERAEAAVRLFERHGSEIELLLSEIVLSGMDGIALADRLRVSKPSLGVLLVSTHDNHRDLRRRVQQGELAFLRKPYAAEELAIQIDEALSNSLRRQEARGLTKPKAFPTEPAAPSSRVSRMRRVSKRRPALWLSTAAGFVGLAALALVRFVSLQPPALPDQVPQSATRSLRIEPIAPKGEVLATPQELCWRPVDTASRYRASLSAVDDALLWQGVATRPTILLPEDVRARLLPRVVYFWQIDAFNQEGLRLSSSERVRFLVGAPPASEGELEPPS